MRNHDVSRGGGARGREKGTRGARTGGEGGTERQGRSLTRNTARSAPIFREEPVPDPWNFCRRTNPLPHARFARYDRRQHLPLHANIYRPGCKVSID